MFCLKTRATVIKFFEMGYFMKNLKKIQEKEQARINLISRALMVQNPQISQEEINASLYNLEKNGCLKKMFLLEMTLKDCEEGVFRSKLDAAKYRLTTFMGECDTSLKIEFLELSLIILCLGAGENSSQLNEFSADFFNESLGEFKKMDGFLFEDQTRKIESFNILSYAEEFKTCVLLRDELQKMRDNDSKLFATLSDAVLEDDSYLPLVMQAVSTLELMNLCMGQDNDGKTLLHLAAEKKRFDQILVLADSGMFALDQKDYSGNTFLHTLMSSDCSNIFLTKLFSRKGIIGMIGCQNNEGETLLHALVRNNGSNFGDLCRYIGDSISIEHDGDHLANMLFVKNNKGQGAFQVAVELGLIDELYTLKNLYSKMPNGVHRALFDEDNDGSSAVGAIMYGFNRTGMGFLDELVKEIDFNPSGLQHFSYYLILFCVLKWGLLFRIITAKGQPKMPFSVPNSTGSSDLGADDSTPANLDLDSEPGNGNDSGNSLELN